MQLPNNSTIDRTIEAQGATSSSQDFSSINEWSTQNFMDRYLRDERELINAYKDADLGVIRDHGICTPCYNFYENLNPKTKKLVPRYLLAGILFLMMLSFLSTAMVYSAKADSNDFDHEHSMIENYIRDWTNTFKQQADHIKFIMGFPVKDPTGPQIREVKPNLKMKEKHSDYMDMVYPYYKTLDSYSPKSFFTDSFGPLIRNQ